MPRLTIHTERFALKNPFRIARGSKTHADVVTAVLKAGPHQGRGECVPYARYGESPDSVIAAIKAMAPALEAGLDRRGLQQAMPPGAARNALDCAFWDLEAKQANTPAFALKPVTTAFTISLDTPEAMAQATRAASRLPLLKIKLGGEGDEARMRAVREAAPESRLIADANEAWTPALLEPLLAVAHALDFDLVEQPLPADEDALLASLPRPVPVCADESVHSRAGLESLKDRYDAINIKLDKTGGLTEALLLRDAARALDFRIMVGCMVGSSLAMAPALVVAQSAEWVDLDGPLLLAEDRTPRLKIDGARIHPPEPGLWG